MKYLTHVLACGICCSMAAAQLAPDNWLVSDTYTYFGYYNGTFTGYGGQYPAAGLGAGPADSVVDERGHIYVCSSLSSKLAVDPITGVVTELWPFPTFGMNGGAGPVFQDRTWLYGLVGYSMWRMRKDSHTLGPVVDIRALLGGGAIGRLAACGNGREMFVAVGATPASPHTDIYAVDLYLGTPTLTLLMSIHVPQPPALGLLPVMELGPDGRLVMLDERGLFLVDVELGQVQTLGPAPPGLPWTFAYNVWNGDAAATVVGSANLTYVYLWSGGVWSVKLGSWTPFFQYGNIGTTSVDPFMLFGRGCLNSLGKEPRLGWRDLPRQGQSFDLTLRDAEPNGFALFWVGGSDAHWPGLGPLPFDAMPLGAPGCQLLASADMSYLVPIGPNGKSSITIAVPVNAALSGYEVFGQSASTSGGNVLGFAASDAVSIRIR